jgi:hypothetical protein
MTNEDIRRIHKAAAALVRLGLAFMLSGLLATAMMAKDASPSTAAFSLAAPTLPRLITVPALRGEAGKARKPPVSDGKVAVQLLPGAAVSAAAFAAAILTASEMTLDDDEAMRRRVMAWHIVGGAGLTPLVVYLIGNSGPLTGSLGTTSLCGLAGEAAGALLLFLAYEGSDDAWGHRPCRVDFGPGHRRRDRIQRQPPL